MDSYDSESQISFLKESIDKSFGKFNDANKKNELSSKKYFRLVVAGFIMQIIGLCFTFISSIDIVCGYFINTP